MITFKWNDFAFALIQLDKGIFKNDIAGHSHAKNSYELHCIVDGGFVSGQPSNGFVRHL